MAKKRPLERRDSEAPSSTESRGARRTEILDKAAELFGSAGFHITLQEIADACGILAGSLYHHFESKDAIIIELVERFQAELHVVSAQATESLQRGDGKHIFDQIVALSEAIVSCGIRHRAALLQTFYEPPTNSSPRLAELSKQTPGEIDEAMLSLLRAGRVQGYIKPGIELNLLAEQLCQSMLHTGVGPFHETPGADQVPSLKCRILLEGLAVNPPENAKLERSNAFDAASKVIAGWGQADKGGQLGLLHAVARAEFGRRGYEATTVRDIASAAGMSTGTVYRLIGSKDALLVSIMDTYVKDIDRAWDAILTSKSTPIEKVHALAFININVLDRFNDEFKIQLSSIRQAPPTLSHIANSLTFSKQLRHLKALLLEGERHGQFRTFGASATIRAHVLFELTWMSENIVRRGGTRAALLLARETLLNGAARNNGSKSLPSAQGRTA